MTKIGLVGCASTKLGRAAPARELYTSALFRKASAYAERTCDQWFILSAKHGLVHPDRILEPYDMKLGRTTRDPETNAPPIHQWAQNVRSQLLETLASVEDPRLVILAGAQYETVAVHSPWPYETPLSRLMIGERLAWLNAALAAA